MTHHPDTNPEQTELNNAVPPQPNTENAEANTVPAPETPNQTAVLPQTVTQPTVPLPENGYVSPQPPVASAPVPPAPAASSTAVAASSAPAPVPAPAAVHAPAQTPTPAQAPAATPAQTVASGYAQQQYAHASQQQYAQAAPQAAQHGTPQAAQQAAQHGAPAYQQGPQFTAPPSIHTASQKPRSNNALLAGLAIGALLGGVVGGGVAAVVSSNSATPTHTQQGGNVTITNPDSANIVSGVAAIATPSVVTLAVSGNTAQGSGSGVIIRKDGYILTNAHVVTLDGAAGNKPSIRVMMSNGSIYPGELVGVDPFSDLAVVKVNADKLPAVDVADSSKLNVGDTTVAIGAPLNLPNTVTSGVVSAMNRGISVGSPLIPSEQGNTGSEGDQGSEGDSRWDFRFGTPDNGGQSQSQPASSGGTVTLPVIQTDASINPGNSGGALLNSAGELIGINVAIASVASSDGTAGSNGLGFAIPSNLAMRVAESLINEEVPSHGLLGASVADAMGQTNSQVAHAGGQIVSLVKGGAAAKSGLKAGDVITAVNGIPAVDGTSVSALVRMNEGGSTVTVDVIRDGKTQQVEVTLGTLEW